MNTLASPANPARAAPAAHSGARLVATLVVLGALGLLHIALLSA